MSHTVSFERAAQPPVEGEEQALPQAGQECFLFCRHSFSVVDCAKFYSDLIDLQEARQGYWSVQKMGMLSKSAEDGKLENLFFKDFE